MKKDRSPRLLHVMEATIGGTKRHLLELASGLRAAGWHVEVACPRVRDEALGDTSFWDDVQRAGILVHEVPMRRSPLNTVNAHAVLRLASLIRQGGYDVVHAHSSIAGVLARSAALLSGRRPKLVYTPHGFAFLAAQGAVRRTVFRGIETVLGFVTDRLIAVSPTEALEASAVVESSRVRVVPNGVISSQVPQDRESTRAAVRHQEGWGTAPIVGTVARMTPQKDPVTWLRVAARVAEARPDVQFVWVWGGEMQESVLAEVQRLGLQSRVQFPGYRPNARDVIAAMDVFLLTSAFEGLPYTVIEALAAGTPVVATNVVGTRDVVQHGQTGLLERAGDVDGLARDVLRYLDDPESAQRMAQAGRRDVLARFSTEEMVSRTAALYDELLHVSGKRDIALHPPLVGR